MVNLKLTCTCGKSFFFFLENFILKLTDLTHFIIHLKTLSSSRHTIWNIFLFFPFFHVATSSWTPERFLVLPLQTFLKEPSIFFSRKRLCFGHSEFLSWKRAVTQVDCTITNLSEQYMLNYSNGKRWRGSLHSKLWLTSFGFGSHLKKITFIFSRYGSVLLEAKREANKTPATNCSLSSCPSQDYSAESKETFFV